jgi:hypothetical protein
MSRLDDGHQTLISFSAGLSAGAGGLQMWEKEVSPPGIEGGGANDTTTMRNTTWRTRAPKQLMTLADATIVVAYDPGLYTELVSLVNVKQEITITFPDASTLIFWGWIDAFSPNALVEGEQPTADITIVPSNEDTSGNEVAPTIS